MYGGSSDGGAGAAEKQRQAAIDTGMANIDKQFAGFDNGFYDKVGEQYRNYATPQMTTEYMNTKNNLAYALARNGLLNSGAAVEKNQSLGNELARQEGNITNAAQDQENQMRAKVQDAKGNVTNQLISSGNPTIAREQAAEATAGLRAPTAFQPIGNMFGDWTNMYLANMNAQAMQPGTPSIWSMLTNNGLGTAPSAQGGSSQIIQ